MNETGISQLFERAKDFHRRQRLNDAEPIYAAILQKRPAHFECLYLLGLLKFQQGQHAAALGYLNSAIESNSRSAEAFCQKGLVLQALKRPREAVASYDRAIGIDIRFAAAHSNRGNALFELGQADEALRSYERAIGFRPGYADAYNNQGNVLNALRRFEEALASFRRALALDPKHVFALNNAGRTLVDLDRAEEALDYLDRAILLSPRYANAHVNRGHALTRLKQPDEALISFRRALELSANHETAFLGLATAALRACDWTRREEITRVLERHALDSSAAVHPFMLLGYSSSGRAQLRAAERWFASHAPADAPALWRSHDRPRRDRIRIAYLSSDFQEHATATLMSELFEIHDRDRFEVVAVSFGQDDQSAMRRRLIGAFDEFYDVRNESSREIARKVAAAEVDIAIDLKGFTADSRPDIFACRPAPIQVSYLGFPGTTGASSIDYVLADPIVLPFDQQPFYSERIVHLPACYQVNDRKRPLPLAAPGRAAASLPEAGFVFCCFNNNYKITPEMFDIWMQLLGEVEGSVLWLLWDNEAARRNLCAFARSRNIDPSRLVFAGRLPFDQHLARYRDADLFLDTLPYNAHTTASEALWMALPVVTLLGVDFCGRVCASLLNAAGAPELVAESQEGYRALALRLAKNPGELLRMKNKLETSRSSCELFDTDLFRRGIEAAYAQMCDIHLRGEKPRSFSVRRDGGDRANSLRLEPDPNSSAGAAVGALPSE